MAQVNKIKEFATLTNALITYFRAITPTKKVEEDCFNTDRFGLNTWDVVEVDVVDKSKPIIEGIEIPFSLSELQSGYEAFIEDLNYNVLNSPEEMTISILERHLSGLLSLWLRPTNNQFIDADMYAELEVLETMNSYNEFVRNLISKEPLSENHPQYWNYQEDLEERLEEERKVKANNDIKTLCDDILRFHRLSELNYTDCADAEEQSRAVKYGGKVKELYDKISDNDTDNISSDIYPYIQQVVNVDRGRLSDYFSGRFNNWSETLISQSDGFYYLDKISEVVGYKQEPQQKENTTANNSTPKPILLPKILDKNNARQIFDKAIEAGLMKQVGDQYKWHKTKALLAYMLDKIYSEGTFPEQALDKLFGENRLGKARGQLYSNKGNSSYRPSGKPVDYELIDELFEEA